MDHMIEKEVAAMEKSVESQPGGDCPESETLWRAAIGLVNRDEKVSIDRHLSACEGCAQIIQKHHGQDFPSLSRTPSARYDVVNETTEFEKLLPESGAAEASGLILEKFDVVRHLGRGGSGDVYECFDKRLMRSVAVKILRAKHFNHRQIHRIQHEARLQAKINHPNFVQVFEVSESTEVPYISMELVEGGSLKSRIAEHPLSPRAAARLIATIAQAVDYAHQQGLIHRDLKPSNILLTRGPLWDQSISSTMSSSTIQTEAIPKIADFGLAKILGETSEFSQPEVMVGTPAYIAPEQVAGRTSAESTASDIYSLGLILYESLTGTQPFQADTIARTLAMVEEANPVAPRLLQRGIDKDLETICLKCMNKDPQGRYPTAIAVAEDLCRYLEGRPIKARPISTVKRLVRWSGRNRSLATAISAMILMGVSMVIGSLLFAWEQRHLKKTAEDNLRMAQISEQRALDSEKRALDAEAKAISLRQKSIPLFAMNIHGSFQLARQLLSTNTQDLTPDKHEEMKQLSIGNLKTLHHQILSDPDLVEASPILAMEILSFAAYVEIVGKNPDQAYQFFNQIIDISKRHPSHDPHQLDMQIQAGNHLAYYFLEHQNLDQGMLALEDCWGVCKQIPPHVYCSHRELEASMQMISGNYLQGLKWKKQDEQFQAVTAEIEQLRKNIAEACASSK